jgi:hypothetical protein
MTAAAVARAGAVWTPDRVHRTGEVPDLPSLPYLAVSVDNGFPGNYLRSADHGSRSFRVAVQCVGGTVNECMGAAEKADTAFLDQSLSVAGWDCGPCRTELAATPRRDPDAGGLLYALATYMYTAIQEAP